MILLITISFLSIFLIRLGWQYYKRYFNTKEIAYFGVKAEAKNFYIPKIGNYSVCIIGGGTIANFNITICSKINSKEVEVSSAIIKETVFKNGITGINYFNFYIENEGNYSIIVNHIENLIVKESMLKLVAITQKKVKKEQISIVIKEFSPFYYYALSLFLILFGIAIFLLNCIYFLYSIKILIQR